MLTRPAFTLVELLVVIVIIGILAALITVAAVQALKVAQRARIKAEIDQISTAVEEYKNKTTSYPPNAVTDGTGSDAPLDENTIFTELKRHFKQAFPRHRESDDLIRVIAGLNPTISPSDYPQKLDGGMSAGEALVFWLSGASADPKYPISGEGGPSYQIAGLNQSVSAEKDAIESRPWIYPFEVARLMPRDATTGYFSGRFIEYRVSINGRPPVFRRINFWQYVPANSEQPLLYFDVSRHLPTPAFDAPAASMLNPNALHVHALKTISSTPGGPTPIEFANAGKFQILHCGIDGEWDEEAFEKMSAHGVEDMGGNPSLPDDYLLFPDGPFVGEIADTLTNFTESTIEDAQP